jgi:hypothetical protein
MDDEIEYCLDKDYSNFKESLKSIMLYPDFFESIINNENEAITVISDELIDVDIEKGYETRRVIYYDNEVPEVFYTFRYNRSPYKTLRESQSFIEAFAVKPVKVEVIQFERI